jgi:urea transport system ATP-binding protein
MLAIEKLEYAYGAVRAINGIDMSFSPGEITCIIGRNGVGKTTLMRCLMGMYSIPTGTITLENRRIERLPAHKRAKSGISLVPQGREIFPKLTVEENLKVGLQGRTDGKRAVPGEIYDMFPVLKEMAHRRGGDLSGGQQQQLAIGRALASDPQVLLLDEPTEGIQPNVIQHIGSVLVDLVKQRNLTIVLVEQYLDFVKEHGDRFYIMNAGRIAAEGKTTELSEELISAHLSV